MTTEVDEFSSPYEPYALGRLESVILRHMTEYHDRLLNSMMELEQEWKDPAYPNESLSVGFEFCMSLGTDWNKIKYSHRVRQIHYLLGIIFEEEKGADQLVMDILDDIDANQPITKQEYNFLYFLIDRYYEEEITHIQAIMMDNYFNRLLSAMHQVLPDQQIRRFRALHELSTPGRDQSSVISEYLIDYFSTQKRDISTIDSIVSRVHQNHSAYSSYFKTMKNLLQGIYWLSYHRTYQPLVWFPKWLEDRYLLTNHHQERELEQRKYIDKYSIKTREADRIRGSKDYLTRIKSSPLLLLQVAMNLRMKMQDGILGITSPYKPRCNIYECSNTCQRIEKSEVLMRSEDPCCECAIIMGQVPVEEICRVCLSRLL